MKIEKDERIMGTDLIIFLTKKTQNVIKYECIKKKIKTNNRICHIRDNLSRNREKQVIMLTVLKIIA